MVTKFTTEDVKHISKLANIPLSEDEIKSLATAFAKTLEYIQVLDELDTARTTPTYQVTGLTNVYQSPNSRTTLSCEEALQNASDTVDGKFGTKAVFDR